MFSLSSLGDCKNMAASVERTHSQCKYKVFEYKRPILGYRKQQFVQFRLNTSGNITRVILYSVSANGSLSPISYTLNL